MVVVVGTCRCVLVCDDVEDNALPTVILESIRVRYAEGRTSGAGDSSIEADFRMEGVFATDVPWVHVMPNVPRLVSYPFVGKGGNVNFTP